MRYLVQWLRLMRFPLVFTAIGDAWAVCWMGHSSERGPGPLYCPPAGELALLAGVSFCLYGLGMVLNDFMDAAADARTDPGKPIPSGDVRRWQAALFAVALSIAAIALAVAAGGQTLGVVALAGLLIVGYDLGFKRTPLIGLLLLGLIRAVQCQISGLASETINAPLWVSVFLFAHVTIVSWIAYNWEDKRPRIRPPTRWGLAFAIVLIVLLMIELFGLWRVGVPTQADDVFEIVTAGRFLVLPLLAAGGYLVVLFWILASGRFPSGPSKGRMAMRLGLIWLLIYDAAFLASAGRWAGVMAMAALLACLLVSSRAMIVLCRRAGLGPGQSSGSTGKK